MGLRYGLLAALTLILASALVWDGLHPPESNRLSPREETAREDVAVVIVGGKPVPLPPPPPPGASLPGVVMPLEVQGAADAPAPSAEGVYTVEKGDSLGLIAQKTLGTTRKAADIARFNGMTLDSPLKVGQELKIPPQVVPPFRGPPQPPPPLRDPPTPGAPLPVLRPRLRPGIFRRSGPTRWARGMASSRWPSATTGTARSTGPLPRPTASTPMRR